MLDAIIRRWETDKVLKRKLEPGKGNPTGSAFGKCAAQMQLLRVPQWSRPEPRRVRAAMVFDSGDRIGAWWVEQVEKTYPGMSGLKEELFYIPIPVTVDQAMALGERLSLKYGDPRRIWGMVQAGFVRPFVQMGKPGEKDRMRLAHRDEKDRTKPAPIGFVLDPDALTLYAPTYVDHVIRHPERGLVAAEFKSVSNFAFRRALLGQPDREKKLQLVGIAEATGLATTWLLYRKETSHLLEVSFTQPDMVGAPTTIEMRRSSGQTERYTVAGGMEKLVTADGEVVDVPTDSEWESARVWTPYDGRYLAEIHERVLRVLLYDPKPDTFLADLWREYGPSFQCENCQGTGSQVLAKGTGEPLKKGPKPCADCGATGLLDEAELPNFPCGYAIPPEMPVLMADYSWRPAGKLVPGDAILGATEDAPGERRDRRIEGGLVVAVAARSKDTVTLTTEKGSITCSPDHPWLMRLPYRTGGGQWREAGRIRIGDFLCWLGEPVASDTDDEQFMGGYIRGLVDGDGTVQDRGAATPTVRVAMADTPPLERLTRYLQYFGLTSTIEPFSAYRNLPTMCQVRFGGKYHDPSGVVSSLLGWPLASYQAACGYLGGLYDADGGLSAWSLRLHQVASSPVTARTLDAAERIGLPFDLERWRQGPRRRVGAVRMQSKSFTRELVRFFSRTRPSMLRKANLVDRPIFNAWVRVDSVASGPERDLVDVQTTSKTFVAGGFVTHNCPVIKACFAPASPVLQITDKPTWVVTRDAWQKSGIEFHPVLDPAGP